MLNYIIEEIISKYLGYKRSNEDVIKIHESLEQYINKEYNKLNQTKNLIFRNEPINFNDNYIPLTLTSKTKNFRINDPINLIKEHKYIGIIGSAGSGKTTILKHIALSCIENHYKIPIYIELRNLESKILSFEDNIASTINEDFPDQIKSLFKSGEFIFLFDGFDEIDYVEGNDFIIKIDSFINKYHNNTFVMTSRPGTNIESIAPLYIFNINPLNSDDIYLYINKINLPNKIKRDIFENIENNYNLKGILNIPLFLSLYIASYNNGNKDFLDKKSIFFRNIIDALFSHHDSISKLGYVRDKISELNKDELEKITTTLAFRMLFSRKFELSKDDIYKEFDIIKRTSKIDFENEKLLFDLTITINILLDEKNHYIFPHILILEYLTCLFISRLDNAFKQEFYNKLAKNNKIYLSQNFYDFLYELDYKYFSKYYVITLLKNYLSNTINFSDEENFHDIKNVTIIPYIAEKYGSKHNLYETLNTLELEFINDNNSFSNDLFDVL